ncbi:phosphatidylserine decarboxylase family protein [Sandarakinorhabdus cyanobacteriorum]|uniref:Phosphatidylserine decarboxylase proenzyme n=1 Tax=Sandarakinorhabdus cyanobacteriorum TaxID=1981098 RepID=A0A255YFB2_9SPHN|nr:phosphatidylserine decarboxylase [Sandarakinorhabdus cyanobacteriorum]OYQ27255.1 phosphatidylserine decarboxylase family protein [Sandarakinorhabdus cyanobacteriorum]
MNEPETPPQPPQAPPVPAEPDLAPLAAEAPASLPEPPPVPPGPLPLVPGETAKYNIPDMHPEGRKFLGLALLAVLISGLWLQWTALSFILLGVSIWVAAFFRDPVRVTPLGDDLIVSPADGLVSLITNVEVPRQLVGEGGLNPGMVTRVTVFMNVFDVHVNRAPVAGRITRIVYVPGKFLNAELDKASEENERQYFVMENAAGEKIAFTQIAGLVARRIMKWVAVGQMLKVGERFGLIRFGSRVDVFLPAGYVPAIAVGQRSIAGETILAVKGTPLLKGAQSQ